MILGGTAPCLSPACTSAPAAPRAAQPASRASSGACGSATPRASRPAALVSRPAAAGAPAARRQLVRASAAVQAAEAPSSPALKTPFFGVTDEATLLATMDATVGSGKVPKALVPAFQELYGNYKKAVLTSGAPGADEKLVATVLAAIVDRVLVEFIAPYTFPSFHRRILEPYNYYEFGQAYVKALIDFSKSVVGHADTFKAIEAQLARGENVVLIANHQTEADPGVFALLLEALVPAMATDVIYVAGDRVVTDNLCKPFSMGRNLFCVHSKKHLDDVPELKAEKQATNRRTLKAMSTALAEGGKLLWIAPSGGRDRRDPATNITVPSSFDPAAVELMRALLAKAGRPGHLYPFAMYSYDLMPPPDYVEKDVGESRVTNYTGCGVSVLPALDVDALLSGEEDKEARMNKLATAMWDAVCGEYAAMVAAIQDPAKRGTTYTQPWNN